MLESREKKVFNFKFAEKEKSNESNLLLLSRANDSEVFKHKEDSNNNFIFKKIQNEEGLSSRSKLMNSQKNFKEDENKQTIKPKLDDHRLISKRDKIVSPLNLV
jgi:hypothetical protein